VHPLLACCKSRIHPLLAWLTSHSPQGTWREANEARGVSLPAGISAARLIAKSRYSPRSSALEEAVTLVAKLHDIEPTNSVVLQVHILQALNLEPLINPLTSSPTVL
jgi:hypothetical protein